MLRPLKLVLAPKLQKPGPELEITNYKAITGYNPRLSCSEGCLLTALVICLLPATSLKTPALVKKKKKLTGDWKSFYF